jgi:hypothetical protein
MEIRDMVLTTSFSGEKQFGAGHIAVASAELISYAAAPA